MWEIFRIYIQKLGDSPLLLAINIVLSVLGILVLIINGFTIIHDYFKPPIDLIFHPNQTITKNGIEYREF